MKWVAVNKGVVWGMGPNQKKAERDANFCWDYYYSYILRPKRNKTPKSPKWLFFKVTEDVAYDVDRGDVKWMGDHVE
jgi:hypothetical protein